MDRATRGFWAGAAANIAQNIFTLPFYFLHILNYHHIDWVGILHFGSSPKTPGEILVFLFMHLLWDGILGVFFSFLLLHIGSKGFIYKGILYAYFLSFIFTAIPNLLNISILSERNELIPFLIYETGNVIWGITLALVLNKLNKNSLVNEA